MSILNIASIGIWAKNTVTKITGAKENIIPSLNKKSYVLFWILSPLFLLRILDKMYIITHSIKNAHKKRRKNIHHFTIMYPIEKMAAVPSYELTYIPYINTPVAQYPYIANKFNVINFLR